ncbi:MAG: hypothetical protein F6K03_16290, partial [Kamptonema sp. SIO4C4]|nr:hypothetical protein [Kamptonema sp. SIO4C4]
LRDNIDISQDGQGSVGLNLAPDENGPLFVENVYVRGFDTGILTWNPTASQTFENIRLENQNEYGWRNFNQNIYIRDLQSINTVTTLWNLPDGASDVTLLDGNLIGVGDANTTPGIWNQKGMYVQNLTTDSYDLAILQDDKGDGNPSKPDGYVAEWIAQGDFETLFGSSSTMLNLPVEEIPDVPWDDLSNWVSPLEFGGIPGDGIDDTAAIQAAIDSGASTVYLPNGVWTMNGTVDLGGNVHRFLGTEAWLEGGGTLRLVDGTASVVTVERLETSIDFVHDSDRTLVLSNLFVSDYSNTTQGTGDLFIRDVVSATWQIQNQNVWARQINPEPNGSVTRIINDGGNLWMLGLKTEDEGTLVKTINGGQTELYGGYMLNGDFGTIPAFISEDSSLSYAGVSFRSFSGGSLPIGVEETRNGVTLSTQGLYQYYTGIL